MIAFFFKINNYDHMLSNIGYMRDCELICFSALLRNGNFNITYFHLFYVITDVEIEFFKSYGLNRQQNVTKNQ